MPKEDKLKEMQPFQLSGEMTVLLPNGVKVDISSTKSPMVIVTKTGFGSVVMVSENQDRLFTCFNRKVNINKQEKISEGIIPE
ncbi:MAG TPA: hypothetical protein VJH05_00140 [Candidatus Paceibacterota bacterium]